VHGSRNCPLLAGLDVSPSYTESVPKQTPEEHAMMSEVLQMLARVVSDLESEAGEGFRNGIASQDP